jgi:hypothetical protein
VRTRSHTPDGHAVYVTAGRVIIESSMIAWVGQLSYCIAATRVVVVTPSRITLVRACGGIRLNDSSLESYDCCRSKILLER